MKADKTFSGVTPDYGTILRVNTRVTSERTAALQEQLSIYDSAYLGGHTRPVRRAIFIDRPLFGLSMMENNIPAIQLALRTALDAFRPHDSLVELDAILDQMGGSARAPAITIIPCTTVLANGYKFADSLIQAQGAWYQDRASWCVGGANADRSRNGGKTQAVSHVTVTARGRKIFSGSELPVNAPYVALGRVEVDGIPTTPRAELQPYRDATVILLPIVGQGPGVFLAGGYYFDEEGVQRMLGTQGSETFHNVIPLRWAVFYQEQDAEIDSPVKKLFMICYLAHLLRYLDGDKVRPSQYHWPGPNGKPSEPYSPSAMGHTGHDFINRLMAEVVRAAALRLEYKEAEELPSSMELQLIRALANLCYFLDHRDLLLRALMNTSSMRQFCTLLMESRLIQEGATVSEWSFSPGHPDASVPQVYTDLHAGVAPEQATNFLWDQVLTLLPQDVFDLVQVAAAGGPMNAIINRIIGSYDKTDNDNRGKKPYHQMRQSMMQGFANLLIPTGEGAADQNDRDQATTLEPAITELLAASATEFARISVKNISVDMRSDYIASALLMRFRESLPVVIQLLKGELPGFEHLHVDANQDALSAEITLDILESIQLMVDRDLLATKDCLEWEEPFAGAHFSTAWQAYALRFPLYPIPYVVHDLAVDYLRELEAAIVTSGLRDSAIPRSTPSTVTAALETVGLTLIQCEPAMTYLPLAASQRDDNDRVCKTYMAGELEACGRRPEEPMLELYGDVSPAHGALKVTSTYYIRSASIWHQMMEMPRQVVARSYNPQPTPRSWHTLFRLDVTDAQLRAVLNHASEELVEGLFPTDTVGATRFSHWIDPNPAFRDVGVVLPYVAMMIQTPPEAYAFTMMSKIEYDSNQRICNIAGSPIVPAQRPECLQAPEWAVPNLATQMAFQARPVTHMILPLIWNAVR